MSERKKYLYSRKKHGFPPPEPTSRCLWPSLTRNDLMYCWVDERNNLVYDETIVGPEENEFFKSPSPDNYMFELETTIRRVAQYLFIDAMVDRALIDGVAFWFTKKFPELKKKKTEFSVSTLIYLNCHIADKLKKAELDRQEPPGKMNVMDRIRWKNERIEMRRNGAFPTLVPNDRKGDGSVDMGSLRCAGPVCDEEDDSYASDLSEEERERKEYFDEMEALRELKRRPS